MIDGYTLVISISPVSVNGEKHRMVINKCKRQEVKEWMDVFRNSSGKEYQVQLKYEHSDYPSIQGAWTPFTNMDPAMNLADMPDVSI